MCVLCFFCHSDSLSLTGHFFLYLHHHAAVHVTRMAVACQMGSCCYHSTIYGFRSFTSCAIPRPPVLRCRTSKGNSLFYCDQLSTERFSARAQFSLP